MVDRCCITVEELIRKLEKLPKNYDVVMNDWYTKELCCVKDVVVLRDRCEKDKLIVAFGSSDGYYEPYSESDIDDYDKVMTL